MQRIRVVDSHTEGEPTRVIVEGGPDLGGGSLADRRERFRRDFDRYRSAVVNEPRGSDPVVGVSAQLHDSGDVSVSNVPSYRYRKNVHINDHISGDIAWGGNWFFLVS